MKKARLDSDKTNPCKPLTKIIADEPDRSKGKVCYGHTDGSFSIQMKDGKNVRWIDENDNIVSLGVNTEIKTVEKWECRCSISPSPPRKLPWYERLFDYISSKI